MLTKWIWQQPTRAGAGLAWVQWVRLHSQLFEKVPLYLKILRSAPTNYTKLSLNLNLHLQFWIPKSAPVEGYPLYPIRLEGNLVGKAILLRFFQNLKFLRLFSMWILISHLTLSHWLFVWLLETEAKRYGLAQNFNKAPKFFANPWNLIKMVSSWAG